MFAEHRGDDAPPSGAAALIFRACLRLYPKAFRRAYGDEMAELWNARRLRARSAGAGASLRLWIRTIIDLTTTAAAERLGVPTGGWRSGRKSPARNPRGDGTVNEWIQDARYALRRLARSPAFTLTAVAILAVGVGANTAAFSLVDAALFRPAPFANPDEIVWIYQDSDDGEPSSSAYPAYRDIAAMTDVFAGVAASSPEVVTWETADGPRQASAQFSTASYFPVLGLEPSRGRWFSPEHDQVGAGAFAVVSHRTWMNQMGGLPGVIGSTVTLNGQPVTVIGVGPVDFNGQSGALVADFWLSISSTPVGGEYRVVNLGTREDHWYDIVARLAPGVTVTQARSALDALAVRMGETNPDIDRGRGLTAFANGEVRFEPEVDRMLFPVGMGIMVVVGLVLLLACSNLANLLLVRGLARTPEMAVRRALGAGAGRVARLFLLEAAMLSLLGSTAGLALAMWVVRFSDKLPIPTPASMHLDVAVDARVTTFCVLLAIATCLFFGLLPAVRGARGAAVGALREEMGSGAGGRAGRWVRKGLVGVQVAVSLVLVIGAGLLARSLANVQRVDVGADVERLAVIGINPTQASLGNDESIQVMDALLARVRALPGVTSASVTTRLPVSRSGSTTTIVEGYVSSAGTDAVELAFARVSADYLRTAGIELLEGRSFGPDDRPETPRVILVNETAAKEFWGGDAIGKRMRAQGTNTPWREVIGVVEDVKVSELTEAPTPMFYSSAEQTPVACCYVLARTQGDPGALLGDLRGALQEVAPQLSPTRLATLETVLGEGMAAARTAATMLGLFSLLALALASLGIYSIVSFAVAQRSSELAIRVALGAARPSLVRAVVSDSLRTVGVALAVGIVAILALSPLLGGLLFQVGGADPWTLSGGAGLLLIAALIASTMPAWRAVRSNPVEVLKGR